MSGPVEGSVLIRRPVEEVFEFVADARNDPAWCERVHWCRQVEGDSPVVGARYVARHHPAGYPWPHLRKIEVVDLVTPTLVRWRQADRLGEFDIAYELRAVDGGTRLRQHDRIRWRLPGMGLVGRRIVQRHVGEQHAVLRGLLEGRP